MKLKKTNLDHLQQSPQLPISEEIIVSNVFIRLPAVWRGIISAHPLLIYDYGVPTQRNQKHIFCIIVCAYWVFADTSSGNYDRKAMVSVFCIQHLVIIHHALCVLVSFLSLPKRLKLNPEPI